MQKTEPLLYHIHDLVHMDCMGQLISVQNYCQKKFAEEDFFVRGLLDKELNSDLCVFSSQSLLTWEFPSSGKYKCDASSETICLKLKTVFAKTLPVFKSFYTREGADKVLTCYYGRSDPSLFD